MARTAGIPRAVQVALWLSVFSLPGVVVGNMSLTFQVGGVFNTVKDTTCASLAIGSYDAAAGYQFAVDALQLVPLNFTDTTGQEYAIQLNFTSLTSDHCDATQHSALTTQLLAQTQVHFLLGGARQFAVTDAKQAAQARRLAFLCCSDAIDAFELGLPMVYGMFVPSSGYLAPVMRAMAFAGVERLAIVLPDANVVTGSTACTGYKENAALLQQVKPRFQVVTVINYTMQDAADAGWAGRVVKQLIKAGADALAVCEADGLVLVHAVSLAHWYLKAVWVMSSPSLRSSDQLGQVPEYLLSTKQWLPSLIHTDLYFGTAAEYASSFAVANNGVAPSAIAAAASATAYALALALQGAFGSCDISGARGNVEQLLFNASAIYCVQSAGTRDPSQSHVRSGFNGYQMVVDSLRLLNVPTFFGRLTFDQSNRNVGHDAAAVQVLKGHFQGVLPLESAEAALVLPVPLAVSHHHVVPPLNIFVYSFVGVLAAVSITWAVLRWRGGTRLQRVVGGMVSILVKDLVVQRPPEPTDEVGKYEPGLALYRGVTVDLVVVWEGQEGGRPPGPHANRHPADTSGYQGVAAGAAEVAAAGGDSPAADGGGQEAAAPLSAAGRWWAQTAGAWSWGGHSTRGAIEVRLTPAVRPPTARSPSLPSALNSGSVQPASPAARFGRCRSTSISRSRSFSRPSHGGAFASGGGGSTSGLGTADLTVDLAFLNGGFLTRSAPRLAPSPSSALRCGGPSWDWRVGGDPTSPGGGDGGEARGPLQATYSNAGALMLRSGPSWDWSSSCEPSPPRPSMLLGANREFEASVAAATAAHLRTRMGGNGGSEHSGSSCVALDVQPSQAPPAAMVLSARITGALAADGGGAPAAVTTTPASVRPNHVLLPSDAELLTPQASFSSLWSAPTVGFARSSGGSSSAHGLATQFGFDTSSGSTRPGEMTPGRGEITPTGPRRPRRVHSTVCPPSPSLDIVVPPRPPLAGQTSRRSLETMSRMSHTSHPSHLLPDTAPALIGSNVQPTPQCAPSGLVAPPSITTSAHAWSAPTWPTAGWRAWLWRPSSASSAAPTPSASLTAGLPSYSVVQSASSPPSRSFLSPRVAAFLTEDSAQKMTSSAEERARRLGGREPSPPRCAGPLSPTVALRVAPAPSVCGSDTSSARSTTSRMPLLVAAAEVVQATLRSGAGGGTAPRQAQRALNGLVWRALRLQHAHVAAVLGIVWDFPHLPQGSAVLVKQYCELGSLASLLENMTVPLDVLRKLDLAQQLAQGMAYLHAQDPPIVLGMLSMKCVRLDAKLQAKINVPLAALDPALWHSSGPRCHPGPLAAQSQSGRTPPPRRSSVSLGSGPWIEMSHTPPHTVFPPGSPLEPGSGCGRGGAGASSFSGGSVEPYAAGIEGGGDGSGGAAGSGGTMSGGVGGNGVAGSAGLPGGAGGGSDGGGNGSSGGGLLPAVDVWQYGVLMCVLFAEPNDDLMSAGDWQVAQITAAAAAPSKGHLSFDVQNAPSWAHLLAPSLLGQSGMSLPYAPTPRQLRTMVDMISEVVQDHTPVNPGRQWCE